MEHNVDSQLINESLLENYQCDLERYESVSPSLQLDIEVSQLQLTKIISSESHYLL